MFFVSSSKIFVKVIFKMYGFVGNYLSYTIFFGGGGGLTLLNRRNM